MEILLLRNDCAEIRRLEPYCYGQFTEGKASKHFGRSHVHWLTGTASTMVGCVEGILGLRPDLEGLRLSPSVPKSWKHFEIESFPWKTASYLCRKSRRKKNRLLQSGS